MRVLESRKVLHLLSIFMVLYFLMAVYDSAMQTFSSYEGKILALPYAAKVEVCFWTPIASICQTGHLWLIIFTILMI